MTDAMPTLPESEASGAAAALYADIRGVTGVPVVNLIWRRLAFFPGALEWAWAAVRPLYAGGLADGAAAQILAGTPLPDLPPWPDPLLPAAGLSGADRAAVIRMLASYDRGNRLNLAALGALLQALEGAPGGGANAAICNVRRVRRGGLPPAAGSGARSAVEGELPPIPAMEALRPEVRDLVLALNELGNSGDTVVASLYRHLAYWPGYLALVWAQLAPLDRDGRLAAAIAGGAEAAREASAGIAGGLALPSGPPPPEVGEAVGQFVRGPIARMTPVSALLLRLLGK